MNPRMTKELATAYKPKDVEAAIYKRWLDANAFSASPDAPGSDVKRDSYVVMMPLPNVTGALHMGHAMDNVMQDLLVRWHRMRGDNTLWQAGTDHAGIATQSVVETRLKDLEGKTRHDIGREALVQRIWDWKDVCQTRIVSQQQAMGCSCDWDRTRFTLDDICARSVMHTFYKMFKDGLIYAGNRLVNWDCHLQTAVANDEVEHRKMNGHFWHLRYPVIDPKPGEPVHVIVATTRPETMLGDTAVACHPTPGRQLDKLIAKSEKEDKPELVESLKAHKAERLAALEQLAEMAADGRTIMLPLQNRPIPLITDIWAKPELGSGCVKITPAHDPNDYEVWQRNKEKIGIVNILNSDGSINSEGGDYTGLDRKIARKKVVADFDAAGLLAEVEDRQIEVGHSDRSKTPIEPYLSLQWFVAMGDREAGPDGKAGVELADGSRVPGLAQAAIDAVEDGRVTFHPEERYGRTYINWLAEKRDWCISRQLWWGHRIPIWTATGSASEIEALRAKFPDDEEQHTIVRDNQAEFGDIKDIPDSESHSLLLGIIDPAALPERVAAAEAAGLERDPDVLDTWFSSALWPFSTLGWPDAATAKLDAGQPSLEGCLETYYPGSCLVTGRDIITLWVARMVLAGLYNLGEVPFSDVFIHANIMDGKGERMSKSKGNGIDPVDIINKYGADAMRYVICDMQTGLQDIRLPVQVESPFTGKLLELHKIKKGSTKFTYMCPDSGKEFDVLGTMPDLPAAQPYSTRFEEGQHFCNKVWNAARFTFQNLEGVAFRPLDPTTLAPEDRWILSRLARCIGDVDTQLAAYNPSAAVGTIRDFFRGELCDWYLEIVKPRLNRESGPDADAQQVLAACVDQSFRLLHPFVPFITEELWGQLNAMAPERGIASPYAGSELVCLAAWPSPETSHMDEALESRYAEMQEVIRCIREVRNRYSIPPRQAFPARIKASGDKQVLLEEFREVLVQIAVLSELDIGPEVERTIDSATGVVDDVEIYVPGVVDLEKEKARLEQQLGQLEKRHGGLVNKLANEKFVANAPPAVVEQERAYLADAESQIATINNTLELLSQEG